MLIAHIICKLKIDGCSSVEPLNCDFEWWDVSLFWEVFRLALHPRIEIVIWQGYPEVERCMEMDVR